MKFFLFAALFCALGCVDKRCFEHTDCPQPKICGAQGQCVYQCTLADECGSGFTCRNHLCEVVVSQKLVCPEDMVLVAEAFCIDRFEASRQDATHTSAGFDDSLAQSLAGVIPWQVVDNIQAEKACQAAGKRLCTADEWQLACSGPERTVYAYGKRYEPTTCNGIDAFESGVFHLSPTGSFPQCKSSWGAFDLNGNLWEHVAGGSDHSVRGGAYNCSDSAALHRCDYIPASWIPSARGFRCCWPQQGTASTCARRVLEAEVTNARELGGTRIGNQRIACGRILHGGVLTGLTEKGCAEFSKLGIRTILDLREAPILASVPPPACVTQFAQHVSVPLPKLLPDTPENYQALLQESDSIRRIFSTLASPSAFPVYIHCEIGRDRASAVTALVLLALGADRQTVMDEFLLSNEAGVTVKPECMASYLDAIEKSGGIDVFLTSLGVSSLVPLRQHVLEELR
jgi:protein-tyrosine phosphatase